MNTYNKGKFFEKKAVEFLEKQGFKIIDTNFYCKGGEIDIIAYKKNTLHFIEVKGGIGFEPIFNITPQKIKKITKCLYFYLKKNKINSAFCISAVIVKNNICELIENITL
jgi:putative endonuclease